jgi:hypothetical protein
MMFRTAAFASGVLLSMNAAALACVGQDCAQPAKVKPADIVQFMREQAAGTRGVTLRTGSNHGRKHSAGNRVADRRPGPIYALADQPPARAMHRRLGMLRLAARPSIYRSKQHTAAARAKPSARLAEVAPLAAQEAPLVELVSSDELNPIDQTAPAFADAAGERGLDAKRIVAQAFDDIDRKQEGSLTTTDLRAASERAQADPSRLSWLQWIRLTLGRTFPAFGD